MNSSRGVFPLLACAAAIIALAGGCKDLFVPKHRVLVDAIAAAQAPKPSGLSYRLVARRSVVSNVPVQIPVVKACVDAALQSVGMFEAPANVPSDVIIEVMFGQDSTPRVDPAARETFLELSGRANPERSLEKATGPELWDVRVALLGIAGRIENAMPVLATAAADHLGEDTHAEKRVDIPQNSPAVASVRETAIKSLEAKPTVNAPAGPAPAPPPSTPPLGSGAGTGK
jgi:hypothetical protein